MSFVKPLERPEPLAHGVIICRALSAAPIRLAGVDGSSTLAGISSLDSYVTTSSVSPSKSAAPRLGAGTRGETRSR